LLSPVTLVTHHENAGGQHGKADDDGHHDTVVSKERNGRISVPNRNKTDGKEANTATQH
jgi:hypothetical protein